MNLRWKEAVVVAACAVLLVGVVIAIAAHTWELAAGCGCALQLITAWLALTALRRQPIAYGPALRRIEERLDEVSLRVVTESQASSRELASLAERLLATRARADGDPA